MEADRLLTGTDCAPEITVVSVCDVCGRGRTHGMIVIEAP